MGKAHSTDRNGPIASAPPAVSAGLLITPYTPPRDVLLWDRDAKSWLRIDLSNELEPSVDWLRGAIVSQLGLQGFVTRVYLGSSKEPLTFDQRKRPIDYFTFGQPAVTTVGLASRCACWCCVPCAALSLIWPFLVSASHSQTAFCHSRATPFTDPCRFL